MISIQDARTPSSGRGDRHDEDLRLAEKAAASGVTLCVKAHVGQAIDDLARDAYSLHYYVRKRLHQLPDQRLLLVVDQFEELFTLCRDPAERQAFVDNLLKAALGNKSGSRIFIGNKDDG